MNAVALKRTELVSELSLLPEKELDRVLALVASMLATAEKPEHTRRSLRGIWKGKGFERIGDIEATLKEARHELGTAILGRKLL